VCGVVGRAAVVAEKQEKGVLPELGLPQRCRDVTDDIVEAVHHGVIHETVVVVCDDRCQSIEVDCGHLQRLMDEVRGVGHCGKYMQLQVRDATSARGWQAMLGMAEAWFGLPKCPAAIGTELECPAAIGAELKGRSASWVGTVVPTE
jgi:hypothetical protein